YDTFRDVADRELYLSLFEASCHKFGLHILSYCLMSNHVHWVRIPDRADSIARTAQRSHGMYAVEFNHKFSFAAHLWQARPYSCVLDERHLWFAVRYVERNPARARMVAGAEEYPWSSAAAHCGLRTMSCWTRTGRRR